VYSRGASPIKPEHLFTGWSGSDGDEQARREEMTRGRSKLVHVLNCVHGIWCGGYAVIRPYPVISEGLFRGYPSQQSGWHGQISCLPHP